MVDKAAREAVGRKRIQTARLTSLIHLRRQLTDEKNSQLRAWYDQKTKVQESPKSGFYIPSFKAEMDLLLGNTKKSYLSRFYKLKIAHGAIATFFSRIREAETSECWWCRVAEQSVIYLYAKCQKWRAERQALRKNLRKAGIQWQR